ncbi:MAG: ribonuclease protein component, partial [Bacteroidota bacterium]|jgi:ribonuclease P protein component
MSFTLGKEERLKSRKSIEILFREAKAVRSPALLVLFHIPTINAEQRLQAMFTVSKKNFKRAHDRNAIKRCLRECYRLQKNILNEAPVPLHLCLTFTGKQLPEYDYVFKKVGAALTEIDRIIKLPPKDEVAPQEK